MSGVHKRETCSTSSTEYHESSLTWMGTQSRDAHIIIAKLEIMELHALAPLAAMVSPLLVRRLIGLRHQHLELGCGAHLSRNSHLRYNMKMPLNSRKPVAIGLDKQHRDATLVALPYLAGFSQSTFRV